MVHRGTVTVLFTKDPGKQLQSEHEKPPHPSWFGLGGEGGQPGMRMTSKDATLDIKSVGEDFRCVGLNIYQDGMTRWDGITKQESLITNTVNPITSFRIFLKKNRILYFDIGMV